MKTVADYANWMKDLVEGGMQPGSTSYTINNVGYDEKGKSALFFAVFKGTSAQTGKSVAADYVYIIGHDEDGKVTKMTKVWNDAWTFAELGL